MSYNNHPKTGINRPQVIRIGGHNSLIPLSGVQRHMSIDDVRMSIASTQQADRSRRHVLQWRHPHRRIAEQPGHSRLPGSPAPGLCHHPSGNIQSSTDLQRPAKQSANSGVPPLECEQRPRVQSQTSDPAAPCHSRPSALSAHARSSALTGPSSRSRSSSSISRLSSCSARATAVPGEVTEPASCPLYSSTAPMRAGPAGVGQRPPARACGVGYDSRHTHLLAWLGSRR